MEINRDQRRLVVHKLRESLGSLEDRKIGLMGLAFKPNTDDMRDAPSVEVANMLLREGAQVWGYDPVSAHVAERIIPSMHLAPSPYDLAEGADALISSNWFCILCFCFFFFFFVCLRCRNYNPFFFFFFFFLTISAFSTCSIYIHHSNQQVPRMQAFT